MCSFGKHSSYIFDSLCEFIFERVFDFSGRSEIFEER